jgi:predicted MFS family arabinose efflux permease
MFGGFTSFIPLLVAEDLLPPANAIEAASYQAALVVGPALAGTIAALAGPATAVGAEIALTFVALALILRIPRLDRPGAAREDPLRQIVREGVGFALREPVIRAVTLTGALNMVGIGLTVIAFPLWAFADLGVSESAGGHLRAAFAVGSLAGALGLARYFGRRDQEAVFFGGLAVMGLVMLTWPLVSSLVPALVIVALAAVTEGPALAATFAIRQRRTPRRLQAQVMTTLGSMKIGAFSLGAAISGPLTQSLGPRTVIALAAVVQLVAVGSGLALRALGRGALSPLPADRTGAG